MRAGGVASLITNPMDVIKTKLQTQRVKPSCEKIKQFAYRSGEEGIECCEHLDPKKKQAILDREAAVAAKGLHKKRVQYLNIKQTAKKIFKSEGVRGFYRGLLPRVIANAPACALSWGTYELMKSALSAEV